MSVFQTNLEDSIHTTTNSIFFSSFFNSKNQLTVNLPKFGFCLLANIFKAVDFPMPLVPTSPSTSPGRGVGSRWSLKELVPYL